MTHKEFEKTYNRLFNLTHDILIKKGEEYSSESDRLDNFKRAANLQDITPAQACFGMMSKHLISLADLVKSDQSNIEVWEEKLGDTINYCYLLYAVVNDNEED